MNSDKVFFTSDTHFWHKNICLGVSQWSDKSGCRDFCSVDEMNVAIVESINSTVGENGILFHLGDFSFGGEDEILSILKQIQCKIHLILGNHDDIIANNYEIQKRFKSIDKIMDFKLNSQNIVLCHYPMLSWNGKKDVGGSWMLHGHCHGNIVHNFGNILDVGVDTNGFIPYSFNQIKEKFSI